MTLKARKLSLLWRNVFMPISSISVKSVSQFDLPSDKTEIKNANVPLGSIEKTDKSLTIDGIVFSVYTCEYSKDISDDISVFVNDLDEYKEFSSYKKKFKFNLFYSDKKRICFLDTTAPVTKSFLKSLSKTEDVVLDYTNIHLDFNDICDKFNTTRGIRFSSDDQCVDKKAFNGSDVTENNEATDAISNDNATQIIGELDVNSKTYTIMLTTAGSIVSYTKLFDYEKKENPMLEFSIDALNVLGIINFK